MHRSFSLQMNHDQSLCIMILLLKDAALAAVSESKVKVAEAAEGRNLAAASLKDWTSKSASWDCTVGVLWGVL